jgi:hypothetical protein
MMGRKEKIKIWEMVVLIGLLDVVFLWYDMYDCKNFRDSLFFPLALGVFL